MKGNISEENIIICNFIKQINILDNRLKYLHVFIKCLQLFAV